MSNTGTRKNALSIEDKKAILLEYQLNHTKDNINSICSNYSISKRTLYDIINASKDNESIIDYKSNFNKKANDIIAIMLDRIKKEVSSDNKIQLSQLVTSLGILYDKMRLNDNQSTSNQSININIKID